MIDRQIGVGVIGTGMMGRALAQICGKQLFESRLVGVSDTVEATGRAAAEAFSVPFFQDVADLVALPELDAVIVATPEDAHMGPCLAAFDRGKAVLVEKPIADNLPDAYRIAEAAKKAGSLLMVGHVLRFMTQYAMTRELIDEGRIGEVKSIQTRRLNGRVAQDRLQGRCSLPMFLGVHDYDVARWYAGGEPKRVYAESQYGVLTGQGYQVEDTNWAVITFDNDVVAVCETGWILPDGHPSRSDGRLWVQGSEGRLEVELLNQMMLLTNNERTALPGTFFMPRVGGKIRGGFVDEVQHFLACIRDGVEPAITIKDAIAAVRIAEAVAESGRTHQPVTLGE